MKNNRHTLSPPSRVTNLLISQQNDNLDRLTRLVASALLAPIVLVNLIDPDSGSRSFLKSGVGLDADTLAALATQLDDGLCQHLVGHEHALAIDDTRLDARFHDAVAGRSMGAVAYCGAPLLSPGGQVFGSLCIIDTKPRQWSASEIETLQDFAALAAQIAVDLSHLPSPLPEPELSPPAPQQFINTMPAWFVEHATVGFVALDREGIILWMNPLFEQLANHTSSATQGHKLSDILQPWQAKHFDDTLNEVLSDGKPQASEIYLRGNGTHEQERFLSVSIYPLEQSGGVTGVGVFFTEVSDRRKNERDLRLLEDKLSLACEAAQLGLWFWDLRTDSLEWTDRCKSMFGLSADASVNYGIFTSLLHPEDRDATERAAQDALASRGDYHATFRVVLPDGNTRWLEARGRVFCDADGELTHFMGAVVDISDVKANEVNLQARSTALLSLNDSLTELVESRTTELQRLSQHLIELAENEKAQLARELHDELGSHLTAVQMEVAAALRKMPDKTTDIAMHLTRARETVRETTTIKRRIIEGLRPSMIESLGLSEAVRALIDQYSQSTSIVCHHHIPDDLMSLDTDLSIALYRIVQESLTNVAKYAQATEVTIRLERVADSLVLEVSDNGNGLPSDYRQRATTHGISGMQQRAARFGGVFSIMARTDHSGTRVTAVIPLSVTA